ncbi:hypothetical protein M595_1221 [Lyngbya aestuarii BL J]|uniref:Uncharacterized protein n=1 Tax=Lyngbya aestuarii BL J TaxID=1348334 RepID=U7QN30_9CYAN|nr:hypothetical protein [Lyngbya aestuarii]ERT08687.1 hypothetical protein M595_1221 [Lyngbya aestuarii BL J]
MGDGSEICKIGKAGADARTGKLEIIWTVGGLEYWFCCAKVKPGVWEYDFGERAENSGIPYLMVAPDWLKISRGIEWAFRRGYLTQSQVMKSGCYPNLIFK